MPYRVTMDGMIECDSPEEAVLMQAMLTKKPKRQNGATENSEKQILIGQLWQKKSGGAKGRVIRIDNLTEDGVLPSIIKDTPGLTRGGCTKKVGYLTLRKSYKLLKDAE